MNLIKISHKQKMLLGAYNAPQKIIIAHGAVRTGKTNWLAYGYALLIDKLAVEKPVKGQNRFAVVGQANVTETHDNVTISIVACLSKRGWRCKSINSFNYLCRKGKRIVKIDGYSVNNKESYRRFQGATFRSVFLDEAPLYKSMDIIDKAMDRIITFADGKIFMTGNPEGGEDHKFFKKFLKVKDKDILAIHFELLDNPVNTQETFDFFKKILSPENFKRKVLGLWVRAEGLVFPSYEQAIVETKDRDYTEYQVALDYGTFNPFAMGLFGKCEDTWYLIKEYYHSGRESERQKTDADYLTDMVDFTNGFNVKRVIVDPSASSMIVTIKKSGIYVVKKADNEVLEGIKTVQGALGIGKLKINDCCTYTRLEFGNYSWKDDSEVDKPIKEHDHCMDMVRYFAHTNKILNKQRKSLL